MGTEPQSSDQEEILSCDSLNPFTCWCPSDRSIRGWRKSGSFPHGESRTSSGLLCWYCGNSHHLPSSGCNIRSHGCEGSCNQDAERHLGGGIMWWREVEM